MLWKQSLLRSAPHPKWVTHTGMVTRHNIMKPVRGESKKLLRLRSPRNLEYQLIPLDS